MNPTQIQWDMSLARGLQFEALWWMVYYDPRARRGVPCVRTSAKAGTGEMLG